MDKKEYFEFLKKFEMRQENKILDSEILFDLLDNFHSFDIDNFYRYASFHEEYTSMVLNEGTLHFSPYSLMNDPSEFKLIGYPNLSPETFEFPSPTRAENLLKNFMDSGQYDKAKDFLYENTLLCCLTTSSTNPLMWAHYANNHRGVCYEYESEEILKASVGKLCPIQYKDGPPDCSQNQSYIDYLTTIRECAFTKNKEWEYEDEWRISKIVIDKNYSEETDDNKKVIENTLIKNIKPKSVILGLRMQEKDREVVLDLCRQNNILAYEIKETENYKFIKVPIFQTL